MKSVWQNGTVYSQMWPYFQSAKGLRQVDPLSPILFNLAGECLTKMLINAQNNELIGSATISDLIPEVVAR